jgi:D-alanyl-D-alanine carboxypeptidase/D-alanyl-D-alanine-endopeptidase (penicillin-binding protein 4)
LLTCRRRSLITVILVSLLIPAFQIESRANPLETIQDKIARSLKRPGARSAQWGIQILDPATSNILLEVNPDKAFLPASVLKVLTTSAALEKLGPDFRYCTGVYTNGDIGPDGTVSGDLILVGRGDPNLTDPYGEMFEKPALPELAEALKLLGICRIEGDIVGDDSYFDTNSPVKGKTPQELKALYGAPISALNVNNNILWVHAYPTRYKQRVRVELEPQTSYFHIRNLAVTGSRRARRTISARLVRSTNTIIVSGVLPSSQTSSPHILLEKPAEVAAGLLKDELLKQGIEVQGKISAIHYEDTSEAEKKTWRLLAEHQSPPLIRALEIINKKSQNLHAEMLLRTLGAEFKGVGTNEAGLQVVNEFLEGAGIDSEKIHLNDGCGLSRENLVTPRFQTSLLQFLSKRYYFDLFRSTLAVSGTDGTLRNRLSATEVRGSIHAKTGTLNGVATLAGYMTTKSGRSLVFSIFANHAGAMARVKKTIDEICALFVNLY